MTARHDIDLERFADAQQGIYERALTELVTGRKRSHWMWFVFPQLVGLGLSQMSKNYAIRSRAEASAYLDDPVLGARLRRCTEAILSVRGRTAHDILGHPDDLKFHSSMTLFAAVSDEGSIFHRALDRFFEGMPDRKTVSRLEIVEH
jgi:uncharacterized protein (DUF1810 family)